MFTLDRAGYDELMDRQFRWYAVMHDLDVEPLLAAQYPKARDRVELELSCRGFWPNGWEYDIWERETGMEVVDGLPMWEKKHIDALAAYCEQMRLYTRATLYRMERGISWHDDERLRAQQQEGPFKVRA